MAIRHEAKELMEKYTTPDERWESNHITFARFIAECEAAGVFRNSAVMDDVAASMDVGPDSITEIIDRAQVLWDNIKELT